MPDNAPQLLDRAVAGDRSAAGQLLPLVYAELRALAQSYLEQERPGHTLQATALVHEAYLKLVGQSQAQWNDQAHFRAVAAQAMRRILIDHARTRKRVKRNAAAHLSLETCAVVTGEPEVDLLELDDVLNQLLRINAAAARVVELRYFGGLTIQESATVMGVSETTVEREWRYARAWIYRKLADVEPRSGGAPGVEQP